MAYSDDDLVRQALLAHQARDWSKAAEIYSDLLTRRPNDSAILSNLGDVYRNMRRLDEAVERCRRAIALSENFAAAHANLGMALLDAQQSVEALTALRRAMELGLRSPGLSMAVAQALHRTSQLEPAVTAYREALAQRPRWPEAWTNLGIVLRLLGQVDEAIAAFSNAVAQSPQLTAAQINLSAALRASGKAEQAHAVVQAALVHHPSSAELLHELVHTSLAHGNVDSAVRSAGDALVQQPNSAAAHNVVSAMCAEVGDTSSSLDHLRTAMQLAPHDARLHSNLLFAMHLVEIPPQDVFEEHERWDQRHAAPLTHRVSFVTLRDPDRPLRIGYLSPDFNGHPVGRFILPLLQQHDRKRFHVTCYRDSINTDLWTPRFKAACHRWREVAHLTDEQLTATIRADQIDILLDLTGHTAHNRLLCFACRAAPVQATYLGYPDTTGMRAMDWRITDALADPIGMTEKWHSERLIRVQPSAWCLAPHQQAPPVQPAIAAEAVMFGSFNKLAKISATTLDLWASVLRALPNSRLLIKSRGLASAEARQRLRDEFAGRNIDPQRLQLRSAVPTVENHFAAYNAIDIALDTYPYHGTTTTCEALWMGVPVVTLAGDRHVSRVGASILSTAGLGDLVANDAARFVGIARRLAEDVDGRRHLRTNARDMLLASPLMNAAAFADAMEDVYCQMWREYCRSSTL